MANELICIFGRRGSGKSTLLRKLAKEKPRRIVVDPMHEHEECGKVVTVEECILAVRNQRTGPLALVVRPKTDRDVYDVCYASLQLGTGFLIIDEAERWVTNDKPPHDCIIEHVERGRHFGCGLILATRRPAMLWRNATANASYLYILRTKEPRDVAYLRDYCGPNLEIAMRNMKKYQALLFDADQDRFIGSGLPEDKQE